MIRNILTKIMPKKDNPIKLGRWAYDNSRLKAHFANHDHCGDIICKNPILLKKTIENENKLIKKN